MVADRHGPAAPTADHQTLQQHWAFPRQSRCSLAPTVSLSVGQQPLLIIEELLPGDISGMGVLFQEPPLFPGQLLHVRFAVEVGPRALSSETIDAGVARIVQGWRATACESSCQAISPVPACPRRGNFKPCSRNARTVNHAEPTRANVAKNARRLCWTPWSGPTPLGCRHHRPTPPAAAPSVPRAAPCSGCRRSIAP